MKEEEGWRELFRGCCPAGSFDPEPSTPVSEAGDEASERGSQGAGEDPDRAAARAAADATVTVSPQRFLTSSSLARREPRASVELLLAAAKCSSSHAAQKVAEHAPLVDALRALAASEAHDDDDHSRYGSLASGGGVNGADGDLAEDEWVAFCDAVRDITKWNEFL
jgi:hypothetical protein